MEIDKKKQKQYIEDIMEEDEKDGLYEELPNWLQTLWNINPGLAERAEKYIREKLHRNK